MLKRKIEERLDEWWKNPNRKPLLIKGCRQIGKSTSIEEFCKSHSTNVVTIDFVDHPEFIQVFQANKDPERIRRGLSFMDPSLKFRDGGIIFLDEIQDCADAITSFKYWNQEGKYEIIASGSMLGLANDEITSLPVGFMEEETMRSLDFEEFLWAKGIGQDAIIEFYASLMNLTPLNDAMLRRMEEYYREYVMIGGFPEIVDRFVKSGSFPGIHEAQRNLNGLFEQEITKYVKGLDKAKVLNIYRHIAPQLAKSNHKYQFSKLGHGARGREYAGCHEWLKEAGLVNIAYNLSYPSIPMKAYEKDDNFRIYFADTSLLLASAEEEDYENFAKMGDWGFYNGALYENLLAEALVKGGKELNFYRSESGDLELDFIVRAKSSLVPIEVKSSRGKALSLNRSLERFSFPLGIKVSNQNIGYANNVLTMPRSLSFLLPRFLKETDLLKWGTQGPI